ncbi:MAG: hypothetical protein P8101_11310 [Candidatus Thiodiazotropha sp.]
MDWQGAEWAMPIYELSMLGRSFFLLIALITMLVFGVTQLFIRPRYVVAPDKDPGAHDAGL